MQLEISVYISEISGMLRYNKDSSNQKLVTLKSLRILKGISGIL
jgi:hypothetical protein